MALGSTTPGGRRFRRVLRWVAPLAYYRSERRKLMDELDSLTDGDMDPEKEHLASEWVRKLEMLRWRENSYRVERLIRSARRYGAACFDVEDDPGSWEEVGSERRLLVERAYEQIAARRDKARREVWTFRAQVVAQTVGMLTGLLGALIGLIAVLRKS